MFNKLREAIMLAEEKEFEEQSLDLLIEAEIFDDEISKFLNKDITETVLTEDEIIDFDPDDPMNEFLMSESKDEECDDKEDCDKKEKESKDDDDEDKEDEKDSDDEDDDDEEDDKKDDDDEDDDDEDKDDIKNEDLGDIIFSKTFNARRRAKKARQAEAAYEANKKIWDALSDLDKEGKTGQAMAKDLRKTREKAIKMRSKAEKAKAKLEECMIELVDLEEDSENIYISNEDMEFLLSACDYELSESEILDILVESTKKPTVEDLQQDVEDDAELEDLLESMVEDF